MELFRVALKDISVSPDPVQVQTPQGRADGFSLLSEASRERGLVRTQVGSRAGDAPRA